MNKIIVSFKRKSNWGLSGCARNAKFKMQNAKSENGERYREFPAEMIILCGTMPFVVFHHKTLP